MMWSKFFNPEHPAMQDEITLHLLKDIIAAVPVQYIYLHNNFLADQEAWELLIMVSFKHVRVVNELTPVLNIIFSRQMEWSYRVFHVHEVEQALLEGSLFFYYATAARNCLFGRSDRFGNSGRPKLIADQVSTAYRQGIDKANKFLTGATFYFRQQNFEYCTFMLHQVFDLMYRAIEFLVMGKDKKTHRIRLHQLYIKPYVKPLAVLFNNTEEEVNLLHLLDEAYLAVRYENNYVIGERDLLCLFEKADLLYVVAEQVYQGIMNKHFDRAVNGVVEG